MRLLNARTLELEEVRDESMEAYAVLSHRWLDSGEVAYQDMLDREVASKLPGYPKIKNACQQARVDGLNFVWVDTCCIDKRSSSELSEAVNSMYRWYKSSAICYAYLSDVNTVEDLSNSVWFTRSWTLQELIAPPKVLFYNQNWEIVGTKQNLATSISAITGIEQDVLGEKSPDRCSIAQRLCWAARRKATRKEDEAYSLLGLFDINMPMLYGEGEKAFIRLQEAIIQQSDDHSIFAWPMGDQNTPGLLADSPAAFSSCSSVQAMLSRTGRSPYSMTNRGLSISLMVTPHKTDTYFARLDCIDERVVQGGDPKQYRLGMFLRRLDEDDQYARVKHNGRTLVHASVDTWDDERWKKTCRGRPVERIHVNVRQFYSTHDPWNRKDRVSGFRIANPELCTNSKGESTVRTKIWDKEKYIMSIPPENSGFVGSLDLSKYKRKVQLVKLGFDLDYNPVCFIAASKGLEEVVHVFDRMGNMNYGGTGQAAQWTSDEHAELPSIHARHPFDKLAWSVLEANKTGGKIARDFKQHPGLWALRGDRVDGLDVQVGDVAHLRFVRTEHEGQLIWELHLTNLKRSGFGIGG